jgi:uncharacterized membrane protein
VHSVNTITIAAPREQIFAVVSDLARWPEVLPHYRFIEFLGKEDGRQIVRMAATRSGIPISWVSAYVADPRTLELRFEHLRAWTKGMRVIWVLTPLREGTRVEIVHDLKFRVPGLGWLAEAIIGRFFIHHVANRTLATFKAHLESQQASSVAPGA